MDNFEKLDIKFIRRCFTLAKRGAGEVSPNPLVGAVLVKDGRLIGEGWHEKYGQNHAEVKAIQQAVTAVQGATLYVNLEPCCHSKKLTPPCTPLIIQNKIKRVVISNQDPNPKVSGKGIAQLQKAGIEVRLGILEEEGAELNRYFFKYITSGFPYVILKVAQTLDGKISKAKGCKTWISGVEANHFVHLLRAQCDAILVGSNTICIDNPKLTVRHWPARNPYRIILSGRLSLPADAHVFERTPTGNTIVLCGHGADMNKKTVLLKKGSEVVEMPSNSEGRMDLKKCLEFLGQRKITSLVVEGGQSLFSQFISERLFDEIIILQAPNIFGKGEDNFKTELLNSLFVYSISRLGDDLKIVLKKRQGLKNV